MQDMATASSKGTNPIRSRVIRIVLGGLLRAVSFRRKSRRRTDASGSSELCILLTGTFYSENWIKSQLLPLTRADRISKVIFVSAEPVSNMAGLTVVYPNKILRRCIGSVPSRLLTFVWHGLRHKPDIVCGFHLLINGLVSLLLARMCGAKSLYICVGGPTEVLGGGFDTENRIFGQLNNADQKIEDQLLEAVQLFDGIIVRGESAKQFFQDRSITVPIYIITAGVDADVFSPGNGARPYDLVFLARLGKVKRIEVFLEVVLRLKQQFRPTIQALIIGDGPDRVLAEEYINEHGLSGNVTMVGHQDDVASHLNSAKVYLLTSKSEGLSQAMIQAMLCGLPAVVANVGSLSDLVSNNRNGFLIDNHSDAAAYVGGIVELLEDEEKLRLAGLAAREAGERCSIQNMAREWNSLAGNYS